MIAPYTVAAIQTRIRHMRKGPLQHKTIKENLYRSIALIDYGAVRFGSSKLVVLPEFWLTGSDHTRSVQEWTEVAPQVPGPETDALGEVAQENNLYICGATMEYDPTWPDRWFNCGFIIGPNGDIVLKYRKLNCGNLNGITNNTTPGDVYDEYVERYGEDALFPVVDTPIGKLACIICYDVNFAETARMMAMRGAEIICHPTGEPHGPHRPAWENARRTRAYENGMYWISANHGEYISPVDDEHFMDDPGFIFQERRKGEFAPLFRSHGGSEIIDYNGRVIGRAEGPGEAVITASVNIGALRETRNKIGRNYLAQTRSQLYAREYERAQACPINLFLDEPIKDKGDGIKKVRANIERFQERGIFKKPDGSVKTYNVAAIQTNIRFVTSLADREEAINENLQRSLELAQEAKLRNGAKVILMPEFWLTGFEYSWTADDWIKVAIEIPGPETDRLAEWAAKNGVYLAGAMFETDPTWPGRFFNTAFIIDDQGKLIHKYRKLNEGNLNGILPDTTPGDVYSQYIDRYGEDALFPVTDTPLGRMATLICYDVNFFEAARIMALKGAEVLLHPTGEPHGAHREGWEQARRTRAYENLMYWASANHGSTSHARQPKFRSRGYSEVVNFDGKVLAVADGIGEAIISSEVDIELLRWHKSRPHLNFLMSLRTDIYAPSYRKCVLTPNDLFLREPFQTRADGPAKMREVLARLQREGVIASAQEPVAV
jgi:predicted amidohydrolase